MVLMKKYPPTTCERIFSCQVLVTVFQCIQQFVENHLVWIVFVICEDLNPISVVVFSDGCGTSSGPALTILALADDIAAVTYRAFDEPCKRIRLREVLIKSQAEVGQHLDVDIVYLNTSPEIEHRGRANLAVASEKMSTFVARGVHFRRIKCAAASARLNSKKSHGKMVIRA